uniref:TAZ-type domain-containing protein n=1 Tax=Gossypium raimondii TaxID=29730 RepID=A0A0D2RDK7_GOSRA|nr:hypothetical protein B456_005G008500 [Gossypium raimondii]
MWQLLELHSRMCNEPDSCKFPLCRHFKEKIEQQCKKDGTKWKLLVNKVIAAKNGSYICSPLGDIYMALPCIFSGMINASYKLQKFENGKII